VQFTDDSTSGGTAWLWDFGAGQGTGTGQTPSHVYNTAGVYTVSLTVTYPSPTGPITETKTGYITVSVGNCTVPQLVGQKFADAQGVFNAAGFTGVVIRGPGAPGGNFTINQQDLVFNSVKPCNLDITVNHK
jgi:PKD repeat protein